MRAFASARRLRLLWGPLDGERAGDDLARAAGLEQSATSHPLRLLRQERLVAVRRHGRRARYPLHDHDLLELLAAVRHHHEHVFASTGGPEPSDDVAQGPPRLQR